MKQATLKSSLPQSNSGLPAFLQGTCGNISIKNLMHENVRWKDLDLQIEKSGTFIKFENSMLKISSEMSWNMFL